jgi:small GTP-binding protein
MNTYKDLNKDIIHNHAVKCIFIGNIGVGKSSIITRYANDTFDPENFSTVGVEYYTRVIPIDNIRIKLQIWDLAGNNNFKSIVRSYYRNAEILYYVFDKTDIDSFNDFEKWIEDFRDKLNEIQLVIIGNKCDLDYSVVSTSEGMNLANKYNALYYEASAKSDINITDIFEHTLNIYYDKLLLKSGKFTVMEVKDNNVLQIVPIYKRYNPFSSWCTLL